MARTNLSLGNLYRAVSGSARAGAVSIGGLGGQTTNGSLLSFATDAITIAPPTYTYIVESTTENGQFSFSSTGSLFYSKVQQQYNNYTCSFNNANFSTGSKTVSTGPTLFPITPASIAQSTYSEASSVLTMKYEDGYNVNATNYGSVTTKPNQRRIRLGFVYIRRCKARGTCGMLQPVLTYCKSTIFQSQGYLP